MRPHHRHFRRPIPRNARFHSLRALRDTVAYLSLSMLYAHQALLNMLLRVHWLLTLLQEHVAG